MFVFGNVQQIEHVLQALSDEGMNLPDEGKVAVSPHSGSKKILPLKASLKPTYEACRSNAPFELAKQHLVVGGIVQESSVHEEVVLDFPAQCVNVAVVRIESAT